MASSSSRGDHDSMHVAACEGILEHAPNHAASECRVGGALARIGVGERPVRDGRHDLGEQRSELGLEGHVDVTLAQAFRGGHDELDCRVPLPLPLPLHLTPNPARADDRTPELAKFLA